MMEKEEMKELSPLASETSSDADTSQSDTELMVTSRVRRATAGNRYSTLVALEEPQEDEEEDEVAMLFAEGEGEDDDFNSDEGDADADMSSSDDDDDQGPNAAAEDNEGEKEIEIAAKAERTKKRKADLALTTVAGLRKKPKIDPTSLRRAAVPKPSKRKERVSWLPESDATPGRTSLRKQTILHRAETHAKLKENEVQRLKMKAKREKRVREKEATAPKQMTQADRLAEAARVERRNAKSLNRWEATEKKRAEEQAARLAALKERKLEGAVVTWYSSRAKYFGLKEKRDIEPTVPVEAKKRGRKPKALLEQLAAAKLASSQPQALAPKQSSTEVKELMTSIKVLPNASSSPNSPSLTDTDGLPPSETSPDLDAVASAPPVNDANPGTNTVSVSSLSETPFLTGIHEYASMPTEGRPRDQSARPESKRADSHVDIQMKLPDKDNPSTQETAIEQTVESAKSAPTAGKDHRADTVICEPAEHLKTSTPDSGLPEEDLAVNASTTTDIDARPTATKDMGHASTSGADQPRESSVSAGDRRDGQEVGLTTALSDVMQVPPSADIGSSAMVTETSGRQPLPALAVVETDQHSTSVSSAEPAEPPIEVISTRNLVILEKFDHLPDQSRHDFGLFYNNRKSAKPVKHSQELCPVTGLPARYRDPSTGIAYANAAAYKKLHELSKHQFAWSSMLGCYVGRADVVARGVPEGFLGT